MTSFIAAKTSATLAFAVALCFSHVAALNPDDNKPIEQLVQEKGFSFESIPIMTQDGYICSLHRVNVPDSPPSRGPVLLQHGFLDSSETWVLNNANDSLGFMLAKAGFDVYLGNSRGNKYCKSHVKYSSDSKEFWQFSWDEMAQYDQPAFVNYILSTTNTRSLPYVGHSQGCTQMFAALISQPEMASKIGTFYALAPVTYLAHTTSPLIQAAAKSHVDSLVTWFGVNEFMPSSARMSMMMPGVCTNPLTKWMCTSAMMMMSGYNPDQFNQDRMSVYVSHFPCGTSVQNTIHWAQSVRDFDGSRSDFSYYNYGSQINKQIYGVPVAPIYNISKFPSHATELLVYSGSLDVLSNPTDVERMINDLPIRPFWKSLVGYDHLNFVWGKSVGQDVYAPLISHLVTKTDNAPDSRFMKHKLVVGSVFAASCGFILLGAAIFQRKRRGRKTILREYDLRAHLTRNVDDRV